METKLEKYTPLIEEAIDINKHLCEYQEKMQDTIKKVKKLLPKGYWWTRDIDHTWSVPKKYSIKNISLEDNTFYITVKESYRKPPWKGYDGEDIYSLEEFLQLKVYSTEQAAKFAYVNRACPKCGFAMGWVDTPWCKECMDKRYKMQKYYEKTHMFYDPKSFRIYYVSPVDELTREKGFYGNHFIFKRLDNNTIIETNNLWYESTDEHNIKNLPLIEFIEGNPFR